MSQARASVLRSALLFSPFFAASVFALSYIVSEAVTDGFSAGRIVGIIMVGFMALLLGYQVLQSIRDLFSPVVETVGVVERQWSRNEFMLFRNSYIFVGNNVFRLEPEEYIDIQLGDSVRVVHYPHTATVVSVEVVRREGVR